MYTYNDTPQKRLNPHIGLRVHHLIIYSHTDKDMEEKALVSLNSAQKKIKLEIHDLSEQLKASRESIQRLKEQIEQAEEDT